MLARFARHHQTGEAMPQDLMRKLIGARHFNQGFATVEFLASAFLDMAFHSRDLENRDVLALQRAVLEDIGMPDEISPRDAAPHFGHIFAGEGYSAGYYSYLWSEVLDADGFDAFREAKDAFAPHLAKNSTTISIPAAGRGISRAYRDFRGRDPDIEALLKGRGLETT